MKVLITGGAGFIGSNIANYFLENNIDVIALDNLCHGRKSNLNKDIELVIADVRGENLADIFKNIRPDIVIHNAAQISVNKSVLDPLNDASVNVLGSINVLNACVAANVGKVIYPSSASMFADVKYLPIDENHPISFFSPYAVSKHSFENYASVYQKLYGLNNTILRLSNVYGPNQDSSGEGGVVSIFIKSMLDGTSPVIYGDGTQTRDFVYVNDVAKANLIALSSLDNEKVNVSTCTELSINQIYDIIAEKLDFKLPPVYSQSRPGDVKHSYMSNDRLFRLTGFKPTYTFDEGITETLKSLKY